MAVTPGFAASAAITWSASATASVAGHSIGTASADRIVVVAVTVEIDANISSCTIGGVAALTATGMNITNTGATPDIAVRFFYLPVESGTTATIAVTLSASVTITGRINTWAMTGAMLAPHDMNTNTGSAATITLTGVTVPPGGAGFWAWANATTGTAVAWTNASERDDASVGTYRSSVADTVTAGTLTITADGATAQQAIVGVSWASFTDVASLYTSAAGHEVPHLRSFETIGT